MLNKTDNQAFKIYWSRCKKERALQGKSVIEYLVMIIARRAFEAGMRYQKRNDNR